MLNTTQNRLAAIAFRWSITAVFALWVFAPTAPAQPVPAAKLTSITGVYNGTYVGEQGPIKFKLSMTQHVNGTVDGAVTFYMPSGSATKEYACSVSGGYNPANRTVQLLPVKWEAPPTDRVVMAGMIGVFDPAGGNGAGQLSGRMRARPGPQFQAIRDADESAKMLAAAASPTAINGVYTGEFKPGNETRKLKISIKATDDGTLTALFTFEQPLYKRGPSITYKLTGKYDAKAKAYGVGASPYQFTTIEPIGSDAKQALDASQAQALHVAINGSGSIVGSLTGTHPDGVEFNCGWISATKDRAESADLDKSMSAQATGATAPPAPIVLRPFEGVYNGAYTDDKGQMNKLKLTVFMLRTAAGQPVNNTAITGVLSLIATDSTGTMPYSAEVKGFYGDSTHSIQLTSQRWEPPLSGIPPITGLVGKFDPGSGGSAAPQISGSIYCSSNPKFQAIRDAAESAKVDLELIRKHVHPGIVGVFNGTYTRENGQPTKFKLSVQHDGATVEIIGMATIYLPEGSGTKAYSYDLKGVAIDHGNFQLRVHDWVSTPPKDFNDLKAMGFNGRVALNDTFTTARMTSVPPPQPMASFYLPQFEATYDLSESADIHATVAAQKAIGNAEEAAAMKARDEMMKNAPPKELASKDLVRKSRQYWDGYQTDMIREVFDGGFGGGMSENEQFQRVFLTYVGTFSATCPECLPANHQTVTVTEITSLTVTEKPVWHTEADRWQTNKTERTYTVEMDPRFVAKFNQFHAALNSPGAGLRDVAAAAQHGGAQSVVHERLAIVTDMQKLFADHGGKSAAMRQMNENFLRAINGEPSLQQAGGKIDGAQAESDKDLPPGRYARFVDGANAYFRERASADPTKFGHSESHDTALCQRLAELYEFHMSPDEEYYYANDFAGRFVPIMGPRASCPDPAWPQLHPDVETAIGEVK